MDKMKWTAKPATTVWANDWIKIQEIPVQLPTGVEAQFYALDAPDGVAVLAVDDRKCAILNRQFRPALGKVIMELPAGQVRNGEDRRRAACRELVEESGLHVKGMRYLGSFYRNPARDTGSMHVYFARVAEITSPRQERYEYMEAIRIPWRKLLAQIRSSKIQDVTTIFAVLMLQYRLAKGDIKL